MSNLSKTVPIKVQKRSGFDKSFRNLLTTKCGTLTPLMCDEVIPNTTVNLKLALSAQLPPLASETYMNVNLKTEAFFVPTRLLMFGYERILNGETSVKVVVDGMQKLTTVRAPIISTSEGYAFMQSQGLIGPGSLADYLGVRSMADAPTDAWVTAFPFLAYHLIWDTWYRNPYIQKSCFDDGVFNTETGYEFGKMQWFMPNEEFGYFGTLASKLRDSHFIGRLRQRNFGMDYFTTATQTPQRGDAQRVSFMLGSGKVEIDGSLLSSLPAGSSGLYGDLDMSGSIPRSGFTIASLRAANSLQMFLERNNIAGTRLVDYVKAHYGANLKDSVAQRPVYLGSASMPVYSKGIYQTADAGTAATNNPFVSVGARYGHAYAEGTDFIINNFTADEPGYIMVLTSLVPEVTYSDGMSRYLTRYIGAETRGDMADPLLQGVGPQPIYAYEFGNLYGSTYDDQIFGYTDRFADWMIRHNELHGLLRDGESLESFALQRGGSFFQIADGFLKIPTDYMDQVSAVSEDISNYGVWIDSYLDYKVVMPLARFSVPSLIDPAFEDGYTINVDRGGRHID
jgi:hypothetical protein